MPIVQITGPISQPLVLDRGHSVRVTPLSGSCRVQIPGEAVSQTLTAAASYGPYSARRDVVITIDSGVVEYDMDEAGGAGGPTTLQVMQAAFDAGTATEMAAFQFSVSARAVIANGLTLTVRPFRIGAFASAGGSIQIAAAGTWYVGVEMWSGQVRLLPRLGHRGWVPLACVVASATDVTSIEQIEPVMPPTRIPRTMAKILAGQPIKAIVMGSSMTEGSASTNWAGMVFSGGSTAHYKVPNSTLQNIGMGGTPNQYQLAQLGFASATHGTNFNEGTYPLAIMGTKSAPNGRSSLFHGCDVVVIGMLANGGDYRLSCIEPIIRNLRRAGVEVIVATDNAQNPSTTYSTMNAAALYSDGPELMRIADMYGVEIADTAAYVFEAHLRASGTGIYSDFIHMTSGEPAGPAAVQPANGHEAWARAVRSIMHVTVNTSNPGSLQDRVPDRESQIKPLPAPRIVTDLRTPGDAFVILPADEHYVRTANAVRGSLAAHPSGANSFARRFNPQAVGATADLLVLTAGKSAALSGFGVVGFSLVLYSVAGNAAATYEVYTGNVLQKTVNIPAQTLTREAYHTIYTPTELNNGSAVPGGRTIDIRCTSGTIRIAALVALTFDLELLPIEMAYRVGTWSANVSGGGAGMPGYATDTAGSYAAFRAPDDARRLGWICSARPNGKLIDSWSDRSSNLSQASSGVSHVRVYGNHVGPGALHYLRCAESLAGGGDGTNGYALHVGGMVVVRDR